MNQRLAAILLIVAIIILSVVTFKYISTLGNKPNSEITER